MQSKLQELTEKIYQEGVEKGNAEAKQIVDSANAEAASIIKKAKEEADTIVEEARKQSVETKTNTESEIRLSGKQSVNALKQQVVDLINGEITRAAVKQSFEKDFIQKIVHTTLENWAKSGQNMNLHVLLPAEDEKALSEYFKKEAKAFLDKGIELKFDDTLKNGFQIGPKDGSYRVSFTDDDFINFFKEYLRPRLVKLLFSAE